MEMNAHYTDDLVSLIDSQDFFQPPPSSFHFRHTPSPQQQQQQLLQQQPFHHHQLRDRSGSRPPSSDSPGGGGTGSIGPTRRSRRNTSVSSTSPPPPYCRPHAIVIPATRQGNANGWFSQSSASEFSLATPSSEMGHQPHSPLSYSTFSIPDPQQKGNPIDFSLYQNSPPPSAFPYSPSASQAPTNTGNSLAGALATTIQPFSSSPPHPPSTLSHQDKQVLIANEKRRRRRESHNAVERRRRDNINEKITELATLIPECMLEGGSVSNNPDSPITESHLEGVDPLLPSSMSLLKKDDIKEEGDPSASGSNTGSGDSGVVKANKGMILRKSVEYIRYLQQLVTAQGARNRELEQELKAYRSGNIPASSSGPSSGLETSSTLPLDTSVHPNVNGKRRQNSTQSNASSKRHAGAKVDSPSEQSGEGDDGQDEHDQDESSDLGEYEDDQGEKAHFRELLDGMSSMNGMVLADEGMRLEFSGNQNHHVQQATGPRGRRSRSSPNANNCQQSLLQQQQHPLHTMQGMNVNMNMNLTMFPDGMGMSVPVSVPPGMTTDIAMDLDATAAAIERGRTSTRPGTGSGGSLIDLSPKRNFVNGRMNGGIHHHITTPAIPPITTITPGNPNGVRLKEELVDVGVALGMGIGMLPLGAC